MGGFAGPSGDAAGKLSAQQVREIREAFQVLDRDNDGLVDKDDVIDVLTTLGKKKIHMSFFLKLA